MPRREPGGKLTGRVGRLEEQVTDLDQRVDTLEVHTGLTEPPPEPPPAEDVHRCPGCRLAVEDLQARNCEWCGFVFSAARPRKG